MDIKAIAKTIVEELEKSGELKAAYKADPAGFIAARVADTVGESERQAIAAEVRDQLQMKTVYRNARTALDIINRAKRG